MDAIAAGGDVSKVGPLSEGIFSSYLVSDKVRVVSKSNDDVQYIWEAGPGGAVTLQKDAEFVHGEMKRGTKVICFLKEDQSELLEERRLKDLLKKHSDCIGFPIKLYVEKLKEHPKRVRFADDVLLRERCKSEHAASGLICEDCAGCFICLTCTCEWWVARCSKPHCSHCSPALYRRHPAPFAPWPRA
eukprot:UN4414